MVASGVNPRQQVLAAIGVLGAIVAAGAAVACGGDTSSQASPAVSARASASSSSMASPQAQAPTPAPSPAATSEDGAVIAGFAFVDSSVTGQGSRAQLPPGTPIYPPGKPITGTTGCPTDAYGTTGLIVAVIDYRGRPTAASLTIRQESAGPFGRPPYYLDLNTGRTLQFLGPTHENGTFNIELEYSLGQAHQAFARGQLILERDCAR